MTCTLATAMLLTESICYISIALHDLYSNRRFQAGTKQAAMHVQQRCFEQSLLSEPMLTRS